MTRGPDPFQTTRTAPVDGGRSDDWTRLLLVLVVVIVGGAARAAIEPAHADGALDHATLIGLALLAPLGAGLIALVLPVRRLLVGVVFGATVFAGSILVDPTIGYFGLAASSDMVFVLVVVLFARRCQPGRIAGPFLLLFLATSADDVVATIARFALQSGAGTWLVPVIAVVALLCALPLWGADDSIEGEADAPSKAILVAAILIAAMRAFPDNGEHWILGAAGAAVGIIVVAGPLVYVLRIEREIAIAIAVVSVGVGRLSGVFPMNSDVQMFSESVLFGIADALWFVAVFPMFARMRADRWAPMLVATCVVVDRATRHGVRSAAPSITPTIVAAFGVGAIVFGLFVFERWRVSRRTVQQ